MKWRKQPASPEPAGRSSHAVQTARPAGHPFGVLEEYLPLTRPDYRLYRSLREAIPLVDAALDRIVRLSSGLVISCDRPAAQAELERFQRQVSVAGGGGLQGFLSSYLDSLLTFGNAAGEMLPGREGEGLTGLYNSPPENLRLRPGQDPTHPVLCVWREGRFRPALAPQWLLHTALRPDPGQLEGNSLLRSLPFVGDILLKVFRSMGSNFERMGDLRYAVTYNPGSQSADWINAGQVGEQLAQQWSAAMEPGKVRDFVAVGDVAVKVIGADGQMPDTQVPVRQLLEQMVAKLGVPPFVLGLHWSSTERMSSQQADIFTSELDYYRGLLTPVAETICRTHLRLMGLPGQVRVDWENVGLQDELELARARLIDRQAQALEQEGRHGTGTSGNDG